MWNIRTLMAYLQGHLHISLLQPEWVEPLLLATWFHLSKIFFLHSSVKLDSSCCVFQEYHLAILWFIPTFNTLPVYVFIIQPGGINETSGTSKAHNVAWAFCSHLKNWAAFISFHSITFCLSFFPSPYFSLQCRMAVWGNLSSFSCHTSATEWLYALFLWWPELPFG